MITRYRAWMDGIALDEIDEHIIIRDISESAPVLDINTAARPGTDGMQLLGITRTMLTVAITLEIHDRRTDRRQATADRVNAWCRGKVLTVSTRPGKRLSVVCTGYPAVSSALRWTDALTIMLTAYEVPYWEDAEAMTETAEGQASDERTLTVGGTADTVLEVDIRRTGATTLNPVRIKAGASLLELVDVGLKEGETLHISHDEAGRLTLTIDGVEDAPRSVYNCLTPESSDDLVISPGPADVQYTSGTLPVRITWRWRARWR